MYNWQLKEWPNFTYSVNKLQEIAVVFAQEMGLINGLAMGLTDELKQEALLEILIAEAIKTSEIEGEYMSREDIMSSIKNNLGLYGNVPVKDKKAIGIANLMVEVNQHTDKTLTPDLICYWHKILMQYHAHINSGTWRTGKGPMQVVSGSYGKEVIHFEAPLSQNVPTEIENFIRWHHQFPLPANDKMASALLKTAISHLYFESIHPFEDGNGRIGRALAEFTLSQSLNLQPLLLSLSKTIEKNKQTYYHQLKTAQRSLNITAWINYFAQVILDAQTDAKELILFTLKKSRFFDKYTAQLNSRQIKVINRMLENGVAGFEGGMNAKKYMAIAKTSKATATRDLQQLFELGIFVRAGAGRSVRYQLVL